MNYRSAIRNRLIAILKLVVPPAGVKMSFPDTVPPAKQDFEGYVTFVRPARGTQSWLSLEQRTNRQLWEVVILGTQVGLKNRYINEDTMCQVADAVAEQLNNRNRLQINGQPLDSIDSAQIVGETFKAPDEYPTGQQQNQYYTWVFQVQLEFTWNKGATPCQ
jgi:hypothetical protein